MLCAQLTYKNKNRKHKLLGHLMSQCINLFSLNQTDISHIMHKLIRFECIYDINIDFYTMTFRHEVIPHK